MAPTSIGGCVVSRYCPGAHAFQIASGQRDRRVLGEIGQAIAWTRHLRLIEAVKLERSSQYQYLQDSIMSISRPHDRRIEFLRPAGGDGPAPAHLPAAFERRPINRILAVCKIGRRHVRTLMQGMGIEAIYRTLQIFPYLLRSVTY